VFLEAQNAPKPVFGRGSAPEPAGVSSPSPRSQLGRRQIFSLPGHHGHQLMVASGKCGTLNYQYYFNRKILSSYYRLGPSLKVDSLSVKTE